MSERARLDSPLTPQRRTYAGLFLVTFATLMYEVLLTRIFSVTMWHHFAFMSISIAMFGMSVGAVIVQVFPEYFAAFRTHERLAQSAALFAVAVMISFFTHLSVPFAPRPNLVFVYSVALTYIALALPFTFSGICVCLALTRFPRSISRLYAADLAGAAVGCFAVVGLLEMADGPSCVILIAAVACSAATVFAHSQSTSWTRTASLLGTLLLLLAGIGNAVLAGRGQPLAYIVWAKGGPEQRPLYEKWSPLGRVQVIGNPAEAKAPYHYGLGSRYSGQTLVRELGLTVDATSFTVLTRFDGSLAGLDHLKYLVMNIADFLKADADVLVLGTGGDRDVLSALAFGERSVVGVEINHAVLEAVHRRFGEFTGHLERNPKVRFVNDDARTFVNGSTRRFDIIQITSIGGVFVLLEQPIYTVEAWTTFLDRLKPGGILSVSRTFARGGAAELYRATALAYAALKNSNRSDPRKHIVVVRSDPSAQARSDTFGTLLVNKDPFSDSQLDTIDSVSRSAGFEVVLSPRSAVDPVFATLASGPVSPRLMTAVSLDLSPTTDDRPYFFNVLHFRDLFDPAVWRNPTLHYNLEAVSVLAVLLIVVIVLTIACILWPLRRVPLPAQGPAAAIYFGAIGFAYILIEMAQIQKLTLFLGHPTYSLVVVLSTLLVFSGIGSSLTGATPRAGVSSAGQVRFTLLLLVLILYALFEPRVLDVFSATTTLLRIAIAALLVAPLGLLMGMPLPMGMEYAAAEMQASTPWLWGINGATSVCGSVVAMIIALRFGTSAVAWAGAISYAAAAVALWRFARRTVTAPHATGSPLAPA